MEPILSDYRWFIPFNMPALYKYDKKDSLIFSSYMSLLIILLVHKGIVYLAVIYLAGFLK